VILRVTRGRGTAADVAALRAVLDARLGPAAGERRGPERFHLGSRPAPAAGAADGEREVIIVSHWTSAEAAAAGDAHAVSPMIFARDHLHDLQVAHFEVDDTIRRHSDARPAAIRLATGRFSRPGADAEMQNLLRERLPAIGDEMAEAWVGRRLKGRAVEVTFVSTWGRLPADRPLDAAFWPDIALRYDQFVVEVYSALE
jgi:hypothetical protein